MRKIIIHFQLFLLLLLVLLQATVFTNGHMITLTEDNWTDLLEGEWMVEFYAPWCPACQALAPTWRRLAEQSQELDIRVAQVDMTEEAGLSGRFMVTSLPTIYHVINGEFRRYMGSRKEEHFLSFIEDKKYPEIEPVPFWQHPNSIPMGLLSILFKISMAVRNFHNHLIDVYNIPYWASYILFGSLTVLFGLLIGVILVLCADCLCPAKPPKQRQFIQKKEMDNTEVSDKENEEVAEEKKDSSVRQRKIDKKEEED